MKIYVKTKSNGEMSKAVWRWALPKRNLSAGEIAKKWVRKAAPRGRQPSAPSTIAANWLQYFSVIAVDGPSTMTRHIFCVPE